MSIVRLRHATAASHRSSHHVTRLWAIANSRREDQQLRPRRGLPPRAVLQFLAGEPARIVQFGAVDGESRILRHRMTADHQLAGERPWLAGDDSHIAHRHPRLLVHFARDRFLDGFARFDEACQRGIHARREARLAAQQQLAVMFDQHDRDRIGAREMLRLAGWAIALPAALGQLRSRAPQRAQNRWRACQSTRLRAAP